MKQLFSGAVVGVALFVSASAFAQSPAKSPACAPGKAVSEDTAGHCCWPGQAWSSGKQACIGIPQACPAGLTPQAETCAAPACPSGEQVSADTAGHCCWPGQVWSGARSMCVGIPQCPSGLVAVGEMCAVQAPGVAAPGHLPADPPEKLALSPKARTRSTPMAEESYDGGAVPAGRHVVARSRKGFVTGGVVLLSTGYFFALFGGTIGLVVDATQNAQGSVTCFGSAAYAYVPIIGPELFLGAFPSGRLTSPNHGILNCSDYYGAAVAWTVGDTLLQWGGLGLLITGMVAKQKVLVPDEVGTVASFHHLRVKLTPGAARAPLGATLSIVEF